MPGAVIGAGCTICDHTSIDGDVVIGDRVTVSASVYLVDGMRIGDDVVIGHNVTFTNDRFLRSRQPYHCEQVVIGAGASIGGGAVVLPGVTIGEGARIEAGAVVTRDVPPRAVAAGNPARVVAEVADEGRVRAQAALTATPNNAPLSSASAT